jgi:hypothetical protein
MEKHPIETWDQLVHSTLHPAVLLQATPDAINQYLVTAKALQEAIRVQLFRDTLFNKTETETALLVERYQTISAILLDLLFHYQRYESITREIKQFYQSVSAQLEGIIDLLRNTYSRYFNTGLNLPLPLRHREALELKRYWKVITSTPDQPCNDVTIIKILDQCMKKLVHHNETVVTYHQASYCRNLVKELLGYICTRASNPVYNSLTELLISWNFNEFAFLQEFCMGIKTEVQNKESDECRLEFLKNTHKQVSQILERSAAVLHPAQPSAKQTVLNYITHELTWLQEVVSVPEKREIKEGIKIHTSITVPVLALLTRLLKESGIVTNDKQSEVLKFFTTHFTTLHKPECSYHHLHSKYYNIDEGTKKKVCDYLMMMVSLCKKM